MLISSARLAKITTLKLSTLLVEWLLAAAAVDLLYQEMLKVFFFFFFLFYFIHTACKRKAYGVK